MQFAVPQFTDVEDKLIGSLTLKQFLVLLGAGAICLVFWTIFGPSIIFFLLSLPVAILGVASALGRYNGRPMFSYLVPFASFLSSNRLMIFKREVAQITVSKADIKEKFKKSKPEAVLEPAESRLKKLAYMLDRKTEEEKDIISKHEEEIIKTATLPKIEINQVLKRAKSDFIETAKKLDIAAAVKPPVLRTKTRPISSTKTVAAKNVPEIQYPVAEAPKPTKTKKSSAAKTFDPSSFLQ